MIKQYGADSVRLFILSDSPPEKDIQWSATGVASANKFLQKIWNLNYNIHMREEEKSNKIVEDKFIEKIESFLNKIDKSINDFKFNELLRNFNSTSSNYRTFSSRFICCNKLHFINLSSNKKKSY